MLDNKLESLKEEFLARGRSELREELRRAYLEVGLAINKLQIAVLESKLEADND